MQPRYDWVRKLCIGISLKISIWINPKSRMSYWSQTGKRAWTILPHINFWWSLNPNSKQLQVWFAWLFSSKFDIFQIFHLKVFCFVQTTENKDWLYSWLWHWAGTKEVFLVCFNKHWPNQAMEQLQKERVKVNPWHNHETSALQTLVSHSFSVALLSSGNKMYCS